MEKLIELIARFDPSVVALAVMTLIILVVVSSWHLDRRHNFDLSQVLVDNNTGKILVEKVGFMTALAIGTWGYIALILKGEMTEWYTAIYLSTFVLGRFGSSWLSVKKDITEINKVSPTKEE